MEAFLLEAWSNAMNSRTLALAAALLGLAVEGPACSVATHVDTTQDDAVVSVPQTNIERRSIGSSWLYAEASWIGAMHKAATGNTFAASEAYWTYWHWFDQIALGYGPEIATGGNWRTANEIVRKYGMVEASAFAPSSSDVDAAARIESALSAIDASLRSGVLADATARRDRRAARRELDRAWGLSIAESAMLDQVFGDAVSRTFLASQAPAVPAGTPIVRAADFEVAYASGPGTTPATMRLTDAMLAWRETYFADADARTFVLQVQKALNAGEPVIVTWFVDFGALEDRDNGRRGAFNLATLSELGPGLQGGHTTVLQGYQVRIAGGQTVQLDTSALPTTSVIASSLDPTAELQFFRVQNAWGAAHPARAFEPGMPAYHDLWLDYLTGPIKRCVVTSGVSDPTNCPYTQVPLESVVLPPGY